MCRGRTEDFGQLPFHFKIPSSLVFLFPDQIVKVVKELYNQLNKSQSPFLVMDITVSCARGEKLVTVDLD